jgi:hypothetical protein
MLGRSYRGFMPRQEQEDLSRMSGGGDERGRHSKVTWEERHWIEYGVFAFVIITAMATATAAWYTRKQWESTADNGHRQLRAYVFPEQANLIWQGAAKPTAVEVVIKNSGQTPAYRLSSAAAIIVSDYPLQTELHDPVLPDSHTVIPPAGNSTVSVALQQPLSMDQLKAIQKGTQAIYAIGLLAYTDAFGDCRMTRYRLFYTGSGAEPGSKIGLSYLDEGSTEVPCLSAR